MQSWNLINNDLINKTEARSVESRLVPPLKNTLKTLVKKGNSQKYTGATLYGSKFIFDISRSYDNLSQLYIKCTLSTGSVDSTTETYFASKIMRRINLRTKQGTTLQLITPRYTQARLDELQTTQLFTHLNASIEPDVAWTNPTVTCFIPLFYFFSEDTSTFLRTRNLEALEIECVVNDSKESMGMSVDLTTASFELYSLYHDVNTSNKFSDQPWTTKTDIPRALKGSFNIFEEDQVTCGTGSTSKRLLLRCPHPLYVLHVALVDSSTNRAQIKNVRLIVGGNELINLDYRINYQVYGNQHSFIESGTISIFFSQEKARSVDSGLIVFSKEMYPTYLEIEYDTLASDYTLYAFEEFRTNYRVDGDGVILLSDDDRPGTLDQGNSEIANIDASRIG
jgi:hypothetical protein